MVKRIELEKFGTGITSKGLLPEEDSILTKVGSFRSASVTNTTMYTEHSFPIDVSNELMKFLKKDEIIRQSIKDSYGGLYVKCYHEVVVENYFDKYYLTLFVHLSPETYIFYKLKNQIDLTKTQE